VLVSSNLDKILARGGIICRTHSEANDVLKQHNTRTCVYVLLGNDEPIIVGEGTDDRKKIIFPDCTALAHQKALAAAFAHSVYRDKVHRIILPTKSKAHNKPLEREIKQLLGFGDKEVLALNIELYHKRLQQLGMQEDTKYTDLLMVLLNAQGCEMSNFKQFLIHSFDRVYPSFKTTTIKLLNGYFADESLSSHSV
jgi:hypothetical protein